MGAWINLLASQVSSSASLQSGNNNTHNLSSEGLAVNSEIAYVWPSVGKIKIEINRNIINLFPKRRKLLKYFPLMLWYALTLPSWQRTILNNQTGQLPTDLEPTSQKNKAIGIVRKLEKIAQKWGVLIHYQLGLAAKPSLL